MKGTLCEMILEDGYERPREELPDSKTFPKLKAEGHKIEYMDESCLLLEQESFGWTDTNIRQIWQ